MRFVITPQGDTHAYLIRRLRCPVCDRIHHELPDFIVPYKRYAVQVIEAAIEGKTDQLPCYDNTIRNFQRWFAQIADEIAGILEIGNPSKEVSLIPVSPLQHIKALYGGSASWLTWAVGIIISKNSWIKTTRLLC